MYLSLYVFYIYVWLDFFEILNNIKDHEKHFSPAKLSVYGMFHILDVGFALLLDKENMCS